MNRVLTGVLSGFLYLFSGHAMAMEFEGVQVPERFEVTGKSLQLNGVGMRTEFIFDIYVGAFYLDKVTNDARQVIEGRGAKRMLLHFVYGEVGRSKIVDGWNKGFAANYSESEVAAMRAGLDQFTALLGPVKKGDEVLIDFLPDGSTQVTFNGVLQGSVSGNQIQQAVLSVWFGNKPADKGLKKSLLGG